MFELGKIYISRSTKAKNELISGLAKEYKRGFDAREITKATPLCASKKIIDEFLLNSDEFEEEN